jgi:hypothetical protein
MTDFRNSESITKKLTIKGFKDKIQRAYLIIFYFFHKKYEAYLFYLFRKLIVFGNYIIYAK